MVESVRAIYEDGRLRLLDPVDLTEGQEIHLLILSERDRARAALSDLLLQMPRSASEAIDEDTLLQEIEAGFRGTPPLSEAIIEERREGP
jgi:predicted DNA-binding antitoxin AbrB/MazE fold protein